MHGDPGIGKTALAETALDRFTTGIRVERTVGVESEMELPYAGLHQLTAGMLDRAAGLPAPQRDALETALGLRTGAAPSPFLIGAAVLGLLTEVAAERPICCLIDDAQWLDDASRQALAFSARRLGSEGVVLIFVMRTVDTTFRGLPGLAVPGLNTDDARTLLNQVLPGRIDARVRDRLLAEAGGNPLALHELPSALSPTEIAGGYTVAGNTTLTSRIEKSLLDQLSGLPESARRVLLVAAADPTGDSSLLRLAVRALSLGPDAIDEAEHSGALTVGTRVGFRHPLVRSAIYRAASPPDRRRAHAALAEATPVELDPDRRAWHRGHAAVEPDEGIAEVLEESAVRARGRGGVAAAAAFLERAAALTPGPVDRARRLLAAAQAKLDAGAPEAAELLLSVLPADALDPLGSAQVALLRAQVDFARHRSPRVVREILAAADRPDVPDAGFVRTAHYEALFMAQFTLGRKRSDPGDGDVPYRDLSRAVFDATDADSTHPVDLLLRGQALIGLGKRAEAIPLLRRSVTGLLDAPAPLIPTRSAGLDCNAAIETWDVDAMRTLSDRHVELARADGQLTVLPLVLSFAGAARLVQGRLAEAELIADEIDVIKDAIGHPFRRTHRLLTAAWRGNAPAVSRLAGELRQDVAAGDRVTPTIANFAEAILANGVGDSEDALRVGRGELDQIHLLTYSSRILAELIEAAVRVGDRATADRALAELTALTEPVGGDWALGMLAAGRALTDDPAGAEAHHREAIDRYRRGGLAVYEGRARLAYGEWLRRRRRRIDARGELRTAHELLSGRGAAAFAARAHRELEATGETARSRLVDPGDALTVQEANVARLVADGLSNREIAARLFLSVRTVEYHLRKVFLKRGVRSRRDLADALRAEGTAQP
ncbi:LuxR family transcriptional regulator [Cryptosporangium japonicum]|uniref:LuxR family transcriptional regulator n=1 Tax=Cryptosporangium japonicum TaxID=80872 RepID=A0ABN0TI27_9ACTN